MDGGGGLLVVPGLEGPWENIGMNIAWMLVVRKTIHTHHICHDYFVLLNGGVWAGLGLAQLAAGCPRHRDLPYLLSRELCSDVWE